MRRERKRDCGSEEVRRCRADQSNGPGAKIETSHNGRVEIVESVGEVVRDHEEDLQHIGKPEAGGGG